MSAPASTESVFDLFEDVAEEDRAIIEPYLGRTVFEAGSFVLRQGEHDRALYVLREGTVEIVQENGDGEGRVVNVLEAPNVFGEVAFFDGSPRSGSVRGKTEGSLDRISLESFELLAEERPDITGALALTLGRLLGLRLRAAEGRSG